MMKKILIVCDGAQEPWMTQTEGKTIKRPYETVIMLTYIC